MAIDLYEIMKSAYLFADYMVFPHHVTIDDAKLFKSDTVLASKYGKSIMDAVIAGAISEYHDQLREELMKHGIDIGEMLPIDDEP